MFRTIRISSCISAQGRVTRHLPDGRIEVECSGQRLIGRPV